MSSRSMLMILLIGVLGLASMGFLTKYAFESHEGLRAVAEFKASVLEEFGKRGVEAVSFRRVRDPGRVELRLTCAREATEDDDTLARDVAEHFAGAFPREASTLRVVFEEPGLWGLSAPEAWSDHEVSLRDVRRELRRRESAGRLRRFAEDRDGLEVTGAALDGKGLRVDAELDRRRAPDARPRDEVRTLARAAARHFRLPGRTRIRVRLVAARAEASAGGPADAGGGETSPSRPSGERTGAGGEPEASPSPEAEAPAVLAEGTFDSAGRPVEEPR